MYYTKPMMLYNFVNHFFFPISTFFEIGMLSALFPTIQLRMSTFLYIYTTFMNIAPSIPELGGFQGTLVSMIYIYICTWCATKYRLP